MDKTSKDERYTLEQTAAGLWEARDTEHGIVITFREHEYLTTQRVTREGDDGLGTVSDAKATARYLDDMDWWLRHRHYNTIMPSLLDRRKQIGARMRELREAQGMTQAELARRAGITSGNVFRIEAGMYSMGLDLVNRVADALGARLDILLTDH